MTETLPQVAAIRSLIVPLTDYNILLPGSVVAEVAPYQDPLPLPTGADVPGWLLGAVDWRGTRVPVLSMEALGGDAAAPMAGVRARLIILKALGGSPQLTFYAVVAQQIPRLQTVTEGVLEALEEESLDGAPGEPVLVAGEPAVIPDLEAIERQLLASLPE